MTAAMGLNTSLIEDKTTQRTNILKMSTSTISSADSFVGASPSFAVIQALVALLAKSSNTAMKRSNSMLDSLKG